MGLVVDDTPLEKEPVSIEQEAGLDQRPIWTGVENLAPTGIRRKFCSGRDANIFLCVPLVLSGTYRRRDNKTLVFALSAE